MNAPLTPDERAALDEALTRGIQRDEQEPLSHRDLSCAIACYLLVIVGLPSIFILAAVVHGWRPA